jgi:hypothetical protein
LAEWFVVAQTLIPALLYVPWRPVLPAPIRVASYTIALVGFGVLVVQARRAPQHATSVRAVAAARVAYLARCCSIR